MTGTGWAGSNFRQRYGCVLWCTHDRHTPRSKHRALVDRIDSWFNRTRLLESVLDRRIKSDKINRTFGYSEPFYSPSNRRIIQAQFLFQLVLPLADGIDLRANEREPAEPSGGGGEWLHDREEADRRGTLSHLVFLPEGRPFFFGPSTLIGSAAEIILTH